MIIDVQEDFVSPAGVAGKWGIDFRRAGAAAAKDRGVDRGGAGQRRDASLYPRRHPARDRFRRPEGAATGARAGRRRRSRSAAPGTSGADYYRIKPEPGDIEIQKPLYSSFVGTDFDEQLRARGIDTLVVVGFTTDCCVDCTVRDAFHRNYDVFVVTDACAAYEEELHIGALNGLSKNCALLTDTAAVLGAWA